MIITLLTDFGQSSYYVAAMKGVILSICPDAKIVDITHNISPQDIDEAAFVLNQTYSLFPAGTIHTIVVDPGVGTERKPIIVKTNDYYFVAPDNGVLSYIFQNSEGAEVYEADNKNFFRKEISSTFHGRDIFAPVAAGLSLDISLYEFGGKINSLHVLPIPKPSLDSEGNLVGKVLHIDRFGNLITNIRSGDLPGKDVMIEAAGHCIQGISSYYAQNKGVMAIVGSTGYLEISLRNGSACDLLGMVVGDEIRVISVTE